MILEIANVLTPDELRRCSEALERSPWVDGRGTAGEQSARAKRNLQVPEDAPEAKALGDLILRAVGRSPLFVSAALPLRIYPPLFNRYGQGMAFGDHIDSALRTSAAGVAYRTDLSCTLFLSDPVDYDGGELVVGTGPDVRTVKLSAGDMVLYPAGAVHRVNPVTRGERRASFFWIQSVVADRRQRELLYDLDRAVASARRALGDSDAAAVSLVGVYHDLIRMWAVL